MTSLPHRYQVAIGNDAAEYAVMSAGGLPDLRVAAPIDFGGPGDAWTPEQLLLGAVQSCFVLTLNVAARLSKIHVVDLKVDTVGIVDRRDGVTRFTDIVLRPKLTVAAGTGHERALRLLEKSEKNCLVSASLATPVRIEAEINEQNVALTAMA
jgi:peroxiredoxin-like protein